jgi:hypothetical protein
MTKQDIVGLLVIEKTGVTTLGSTSHSISELLWGISDVLVEQAKGSLADGGALKLQVIELGSGDVLMELTIDCKKPFEEILKFQPHD